MSVRHALPTQKRNEISHRFRVKNQKIITFEKNQFLCLNGEKILKN